MPKKRAAPADTSVAEPVTKRRTRSTAPAQEVPVVSKLPKTSAKPPSTKGPKPKKSTKPISPKESKPKESKPKTIPAAKPGNERAEGEARHWLMKAEPETRIENGIDVRFSIDDLAAKTKPEPWDGIRNHVAKNNILAMRKGDLAFFYHSNCKVPGIVGLMEVVGEAIPDGLFKSFALLV
jgi:EVE domain